MITFQVKISLKEWLIIWNNSSEKAHLQSSIHAFIHSFMTPTFTFMSSQKFTYSFSSWTTKTKQTNKEKESDEFYTNLEHEYWRNIWPWTAGETRLKLKLYAWWVSVRPNYAQAYAEKWYGVRVFCLKVLGRSGAMCRLGCIVPSSCHLHRNSTQFSFNANFCPAS